MGCTCMPHVCVAVSGRQEEFACLSGQACGAPHIVIRIACTVHSRTNCTGSCSHPARHCAALLPLAGPGRLVGVRHQPSGQCRVSCRIVVVICSLGARPTVHVWRQGVSNVFAWHARQALLVVPLHARQHASHELRSMLHVAGGWQPFHPRKRALLSVCCVCRPTRGRSGSQSGGGFVQLPAVAPQQDGQGMLSALTTTQSAAGSCLVCTQAHGHPSALVLLASVDMHYM